MITKMKAFLIYLDEDLKDRLDEWRSTQRPIPSRSEAVRTLLREALKEKVDCCEHTRPTRTP